MAGILVFSLGMLLTIFAANKGLCGADWGIGRLGGEDLIRHSTWESDGLKIFGPNPEHWWRNVLLPGDGVGGCWIERETDVKGKRLSGGQF